MVKQISRRAPGQEQGQAACRHHWVIEAPTGPVSRGACQLCEKVRDFKNYIESAPWGEDAPAARSNSRIPVLVSTGDSEDPDEA